MGSTVVTRTCSLCTAKDPCTSNARTHAAPRPASVPRPSWPLPSGRPNRTYMSSRRYREEHTISRVVKSESLQQCSIIKKTAAVKKSITVVEESESHSPYRKAQPWNHKAVLCCIGRGRCAASDVPESGWLQLASGNTVGSTLEMLLPCHTCEYRPGTHLSHGRHQRRMARSVANVQCAHSLRARVFAVERSSLWS
jgi:hypothetical protein